ncbi:uncharacterized protein LOC106665116 isoform X2 [Cimex lectularius]|uniref:CPR type cuticle protein n=1 Tax=Cimex lectularius TaxID=79782 RepID=A0A8I6TFL5_CIMLE|nr:uncharacterized protein LOC106665116 isoform X2 [Cimex lectularius]
MTTVFIAVVVGLLGAVNCSPLPSRDILAGQEFLELYMRTQPRSSGSYFINNNIIQNEVKSTVPPLTSTSIPVVTEATTGVTSWTTEAEEEPSSEVVKVSVTSSIARQMAKPHEITRIATTLDEPTITAIQRSHFGVDETSGVISIKKEPPESSFTVERSQNGENTSFTVRQIHQGDSTSSFTIQRNVPINLEKVEERTSYTVVSKQEPKQEPSNEEETVVEQRTFTTEARTARGDPAKTVEPAKNWQYQRPPFTPKQDNHDESKSYTSTQINTDAPKAEEFVERQSTKAWPHQERTIFSTERDPRVYRQEARKNWEYQERVYAEPEKNYEVDEAVSVMTNGRVHGVQPVSTPSPNKLGYVVEGSNYRKYRVEEKTPDGFIVGEYGVVSHDDGSLRGVRYTADSNINPRLIYDALVKFLSLK